MNIVTLPSGEYGGSRSSSDSDKEDFESVSGGSIAGNEDERGEDITGMDYQLKDELEDGTEDRSESDPSLDPLDPFITLLHHRNETKETGGIRGDDDDEHTGLML